MMAPPHRWFDAFVDAGWPARLSPPALRLVWAIARRVDRQGQTCISLSRLQEEARLSARSFWRAKTKLMDYGLLQRTRERPRRWTLALIVPVPPVLPMAQKTANRGSKNCQPWQQELPTGAQGDGQKPPGTRETAAGQQKTEAQLEGKTGEPFRGVTKFLDSQGVPPAFIPLFLDALQDVRSLPDKDGVRPAADVALDLSRRLNAQDARMPDGRLWFGDAVAALLGDALDVRAADA